ncbi:MAG: hypothetical protein IPG45_03610 [Deltaproteobacteria bacterium]|nr:hypothetical protein [Deltaproteobacteria bacterium]
MKLFPRFLLSSFAALAILAQAPAASAQGADLHYAQAGALLTYAEAEVKILYAALSAKEFDPSITKSVIDELNRALNESKKRVDRTIPLLDEKDKAAEPDMLKLREAIKKCEDELTKLNTDISEQTGASDDDEDKKDDEEEERPQTDWELLKRGTSWLSQDIATAKTAYGALAKKLKLPTLAAPPKPKGKREE